MPRPISGGTGLGRDQRPRRDRSTARLGLVVHVAQALHKTKRNARWRVCRELCDERLHVVTIFMDGVPTVSRTMAVLAAPAREAERDRAGHRRTCTVLFTERALKVFGVPVGFARPPWYSTQISSAPRRHETDRCGDAHGGVADMPTPRADPNISPQPGRY